MRSQNHSLANWKIISQSKMPSASKDIQPKRSQSFWVAKLHWKTRMDLSLNYYFPISENELPRLNSHREFYPSFLVCFVKSILPLTNTLIKMLLWINAKGYLRQITN